MSLYEINQADIGDLHSLISSATLGISANNAKRVAYLQTMLEQLKPSTAIDELKARADKLEAEVQECLRARDAALLEAGLAKGREAKLSGAVTETVAALEANDLGECSECQALRDELKKLA